MKVFSDLSQAAFKQREETSEKRVAGQCFRVLMGGKVLATNKTYEGALRTAEVFGPDAEIRQGPLRQRKRVDLLDSFEE